MGELFTADVTWESASFVYALLMPHEMIVTGKVLVTVGASVLFALMLGFRVQTSRSGVSKFFTTNLHHCMGGERDRSVRGGK